MAQIRQFPRLSELAQAAIDSLIADLSAAIATHGNATWVIVGGSTPLAAYKLIAAQPGGTVDWSKVTVIIGDERCVAFDSPDSNWTQAETALLRYLPLAAAVRPACDLDAEEAAGQYDSYLRQLPQTSGGLPRLDHVWLGVGEDGHTLSLFPDHPSLKTDTGDALVIAVHGSPKPPPDRITLTFKALQGTVNCLVMAAGSPKADAVHKALANEATLPVAVAVRTIEAAGGSVSWLLDDAAAGQAND